MPAAPGAGAVASAAGESDSSQPRVVESLQDALAAGLGGFELVLELAHRVAGLVLQLAQPDAERVDQVVAGQSPCAPRLDDLAALALVALAGLAEEPLHADLGVGAIGAGDLGEAARW